MLDRYLPAGSARRKAALVAAAVLATLLFTQLLLPGPGDDPRGTPAAILFLGAASGLITALTAVGIVVVYRTIRVINFAQTAIGAAGALFTFELIRYTEVPFLISVLLGLVLAGLIGAVVDLALIRRFFNAPRLIVTVVTIALAGFLGQISADAIPALPIFPDAGERSLDDMFGPLTGELPFQGFTFQVGELPLQFGFAHVFAIDVALLLFAGVAAFFRFTRAGVGVRALAENSERAALLGISVGALSTIVWALAGVLSGATITLQGLMTTPLVARGIAGEALFIALAAAVLGRMRSIPVTAFASILLTVATTAAAWSLPNDEGLVLAGLLAIVAVALFFQRKDKGRSEESGGVGWQATEEQRPIPAELADVPTVKWSKRAAALVGVAVLLVIPWVTSVGVTNLGGVIALYGVAALSLVVLTGWAGQVSLGQFAFVSIGAAVGAALTSRVGVPFWVAVPLAAAITGGVAVAVGIPALRLRGLFLAVVTFGFALVVSGVLFNESYFGWLLPTDTIERPTLFFLDFADERSMYYLCVATLVAAIVLVGNLRRSRTGRVLIAARENEANLQSFGVSLVRTKLVAFGVAGVLCGLSGSVLVHQQQALNPNTFAAGESMQLFLMVVIGGVGSVAGALLGTGYFQITEYFLTGNVIVAFLQGFATLVVLFASPGGMLALLGRARDEWLRIIAQRRQILVPSLFADYDAEALERKLIPLGDPSGAGGLAALPPTARWALASTLYQGRGVRVADRLKPGRTSREAAAIGAAGEAMNDRPLDSPAPGRANGTAVDHSTTHDEMAAAGAAAKGDAS